jgi:dihydrofolate synthase/folylpolyglutamate synthase
MHYEQAIAWLFSRFPAYQNIGVGAYKPDLENVKRLLYVLNNPEQSLKFIHIAGTNGKGSTSHILSALCQTHGLKTGLFSSPHLIDFRERIKVNGVQIPESKVIDWVEHIVPNLKINFEPSFFELTFALALAYYNEQNCDICIIETGLGGRLDATNVINPLLSVITNIGLDHQNLLGNTRPEIAKEKAGIIKANTPILIAEQDPETRMSFESKVMQEHAILKWVDHTEYIESDLLGDFQQLNLRTAKQAFLWLCEINQMCIEPAKIREALLNVSRITNFRGRMELIQNEPTVIFDVAHNAPGIRVLMKEIKKRTFRNLYIIFGTSNDKNFDEILPILPQNATYHFCQFKNGRTRQISEWEEIGQSHFSSYSVYKSPKDAYLEALQLAQKDDIILAFGSFFLVGELLEALQL